MKRLFMEYQYIKLEIKHLKERIAKLPEGTVHDYGIDYSTGEGRTFPISGVVDSAPRLILSQVLRDRYDKAVALATQVEQAIAGCPDARARLVLELYYVQGYTNTAIACKLGTDEATVRRIKKDYFKRAENAEKSEL